MSHLRFCDNGYDVENELFRRGSNCLSKFEFSIIKEASALDYQVKMMSLALTVNYYVSSNILAPIITKFANESINTKIVKSHADL